MNRKLTFAVLICCAQLARAQTGGTRTGLDALSDDKLYSELASRQLNSLLDRAFEINKVPASRREGIIAFSSLAQLSNSKLPYRQRKELLEKVVNGIDAALPSISDPTTLLTSASTIMEVGVDVQVNTLEYWGDNPATRAQLKPAAEAVSKLYDKAIGEYNKKLEDLSKRVSNPSSPEYAMLRKLYDQVAIVTYNKNMVDYNVALAMNPGEPARDELIDKSITALSEYDSPDSQVQVVVRNRIAKYKLLKGDYKGAKTIFATVIDNPKDEIKPAPNAVQQYEARYFSIVADLLSGELGSAEKAIPDLKEWQTRNIGDPEAQKGADAALEMLRFRVADQRAKTAKNDNDRKKYNAEAIKVLRDLRKSRPQLAAIIDEQMMTRLPEDVDLKREDPLLLQALVTAADRERLKPENANARVMTRGLDAARELVARGEKKGVDAKMLDDAAFLIPLLLEKQGEKSAVPAANAYLDYIKARRNANQDRAKDALNEAGRIIFNLRKNPDNLADEELTKAYERFLPIAIDAPFNHVEFASEYGQRLQRAGNFRDAMKYLDRVPKDSPSYLNSRSVAMIARKQLLDDPKLSSGEKGKLLSEIQRLVDEVQQSAQAALSKATDDKGKTIAKQMIVRAKLVGASLARHEQNDPKRTLALLEGFHEAAAGLANENDLEAEALQLHVSAHMAQGNVKDAVEALVQLSAKRPGQETAQIVFGMLKKLNDDLEIAQNKGDKAEVKQLAGDRAKLSGFLSEWANNSDKPEIRKQAYNYARFDATTKHLAAELMEDPDARTKALQDCVEQFKKLQSPEMLAQYKASAGEKAGDYDPMVVAGIASIQFDLKNFEEARDGFGRLLSERKLGTASKEIQRDGQFVVVDNDQYWEGNYKQLRSIAELGKADAGKFGSELEDARKFLKRLYVLNREKTGGARWHEAFESLRKELVPDFDPESLVPQQPAPTTAP